MGKGNLVPVGSWVHTPPGPNFFWPVETPKFPLIRVYTQGIWCISSIAYFRHLINKLKIHFYLQVWLKIWTQVTEKQIQVVISVGFEPETAGLRGWYKTHYCLYCSPLNFLLDTCSKIMELFFTFWMKGVKAKICKVLTFLAFNFFSLAC